MHTDGQTDARTPGPRHLLGGELSSLAGRPSSPALHGPLSWQIARRASLEMRGKLKPRGCPVLGAWLSAGSPAVRSSNTGGPGGFYPHSRSPSGLSWLYKRWVGGLDEAGSQSRIPSWRVLSRFWGSWDRDFGEGRPQDGYPGREGALGLPLPAPAALGLPFWGLQLEAPTSLHVQPERGRPGSAQRGEDRERLLAPRPAGPPHPAHAPDTQACRAAARTRAAAGLGRGTTAPRRPSLQRPPAAPLCF